jgi:hypothetical protein
LIELHEAVEDLARDRKTVNIPDPTGIERLRVMSQRSSIDTARRRLRPCCLSRSWSRRSNDQKKEKGDDGTRTSAAARFLTALRSAD